MHIGDEIWDTFIFHPYLIGCKRDDDMMTECDQSSLHVGADSRSIEYNNITNQAVMDLRINSKPFAYTG